MQPNTTVKTTKPEENAEELEISRKLAEKLKKEGNEAFKNGKYALAILKYSDALEEHQGFSLFCNRANCYIKTESFGLAISDSKEAINCEKSNPKGYYRLGTAYYLLGKYKLAKQAFKSGYKVKPSKLFRNQVEKSKAEERRVAFEEAISYEDKELVIATYDISKVDIPETYTGPRLKKTKAQPFEVDPDTQSPDKVVFQNGENVDEYCILPEIVLDSIQWMFEQQKLHRKVVVIALIKLYKLLQELPSLIDIDFGDNVTFNVCGDTHGQFYDLKNIFDLNGVPSSTNQYLFNGDFVDRGSFSVEVVLTLFLWKLAYPSYVHLLRGNHETRNMNRVYGFEGEVKAKYDQTIYELFSEVFRQLPLAAVINKKIIVMHGGLPTVDGVTLDDIRKVDRNREPHEDGLMADLLWSDPQNFKGRAASKRGVGKSFGPDITAKFLEENNLDLIIRSHEVRDEGYLVEHEGKLITVFSAPNYCDHMGNKGAIVRLKKDLKPDFLKFEAVSHPDIKAMAYAPNLGMFA